MSIRPSGHTISRILVLSILGIDRRVLQGGSVPSETLALTTPRTVSPVKYYTIFDVFAIFRVVSAFHWARNIEPCS